MGKQGRKGERNIISFVCLVILNLIFELNIEAVTVQDRQVRRGNLVLKGSPGPLDWSENPAITLWFKVSDHLLLFYPISFHLSQFHQISSHSIPSQHTTLHLIPSHHTSLHVISSHPSSHPSISHHNVSHLISLPSTWNCKVRPVQGAHQAHQAHQVLQVLQVKSVQLVYTLAREILQRETSFLKMKSQWIQTSAERHQTGPVCLI